MEPKEQTRRHYRQLRATADRVRERAVFQKAGLDPEQAILFEEMLLELDRYFMQ